MEVYFSQIPPLARGLSISPSITRRLRSLFNQPSPVTIAILPITSCLSLSSRPYLVLFAIVGVVCGSTSYLHYKTTLNASVITVMQKIEAVNIQTVSLGAILFEGIMQCTCQGVIFAQVCRYWEIPLDDTRRMKGFVAVLLILSSLQTGLTIYKLWHALVEHLPWSKSSLYFCDILLNGLICTISETFLVRRCWKATSKNRWVLVGLASIAATAFVAILYLSVAIARGRRSTFPKSNNPLMSDLFFDTVLAFNVWIFASLVLDLSVTSILMVYLWKSKTGLGYLDKALKHIIGITWESAATPSILMIISVILYHCKTPVERRLSLPFILLTGKFYILGLLRTLNSRPKLRERMKSHDLGRTSLSDWTWNQPSTIGNDLPIAPDAALPQSSVWSSTIGDGRRSSLAPTFSTGSTRQTGRRESTISTLRVEQC